ncbi:MAG: type II toxin-antitoxin system PemK/MazF family toxin [Sporichthyaceae bacterium]
MRAIHLAELDKRRPVLVLTRDHMVGVLSTVCVAPISRVVHGVHSEVALDPRNGLGAHCVVKCDQVQSVTPDQLGQRIGYLLDSQEPDLAAAIAFAFDLR